MENDTTYIIILSLLCLSLNLKGTTTPHHHYFLAKVVLPSESKVTTPRYCLSMHEPTSRHSSSLAQHHYQKYLHQLQTSMPRPTEDPNDEKQGTSSPQSLGGKRKLAKEEVPDSSEEDREGDEDEDEEESDLGSGTDGDGGGLVTKVRREKRLAMNRASARARRKRKKVLLDSLANQVTDLTKRNQTIQLANDTLQGRVEQLESALSQAQATIASLLTEPRQTALTQQQQQLGQGMPNLGRQEDLLALLQAASSSLNSGGAGMLGGGVGRGLDSTAISSRLGQQNLLNAHLLAAHQGGVGQQSRSQLLEAAALGGAFRLPSHDQGFSAASASPISSFLGQIRFQNQHIPSSLPPQDHSVGSTSGESKNTDTSSKKQGVAGPQRSEPGFSKSWRS